jgi:beta-glucosidase
MCLGGPFLVSDFSASSVDRRSRFASLLFRFCGFIEATMIARFALAPKAVSSTSRPILLAVLLIAVPMATRAENSAALSPGKSMAECVARANKIVAQMTLAEKIQQVYGSGNRSIVGIPRLGIPTYNFTNGPAGAGHGGKGHEGPATALPAPIALAATFDLQQAASYGRICGQDALDYSCNMIEAPSVNIVRCPEGGRAFEGLGEDPYLAGRMAVADIQAIQKQGINAETKHFAANNQEDHRGTNNSVIDERTLREIYLPAFEATVKTGRVDAIMSAYNHLNGIYCSENKMLLTDLLKTEWNFDGYITSDFGAVHSTVPTALAGLDAEMPTGKYFGALQKAVEAGQVPVSRIDDMLVRRFSKMMLRGTWHDPLPNQPVAVKEEGSVSRQIAETSMVLLKNKASLLPLHAASLHTIALIGPAAIKAKTGGGGSSQVKAVYEISPLEGLRSKAGPGIAITLDDGKDSAKAAALAHGADVAIVMIGDQETEGKDHALALDEATNALVEAVAAANPRTIVVLKTGSAVLMPWLQHVPAILEAWYPGEEDGNAVADVLFGNANPSGKLPLTFPARTADQPAQISELSDVNYTEGVLVGYRHYDAHQIEPLFPFGYGLSYTTFKYENLVVSPATASFANDPAQQIAVDFDITNSGAVSGAEVAQVYVGKPALPGGLQEPPDWLKGFQKLLLEPAASGHLHLVLDARAFSYWDVASHGWKIAPGTYKILVGSSSRDIRLRGTVTLH